MRDCSCPGIAGPGRPGDEATKHRAAVACLVMTVVLWLGSGVSIAADRVVERERFAATIQPVLETYCYGCHGDGAKKGGVDLGGLEADERRLGDRDLWWSVLRNVRAGLMPPAGKPQPSGDEKRLLERWIKFQALGIDPNDPDPGRVTVRRLNRTEYRNTIRDLMGLDYDTTAEFPPDDTGHGFDNIGDVLTLSSMLLEKYLAAAEAIVARAVPTTSRIVAETTIPGKRFGPAGAPGASGPVKDEPGPLSLPYYDPLTVAATHRAEHPGRYRLVVDLTANERFVDGSFDYNKCRLIFRVDGQELGRREFVRQDGRAFRLEFDRDWQAGAHELSFEIQPVTPVQPRVRSLAIRLQGVTVRGPFDERYWVRPTDYARFFPKDVPDRPADRRVYTRELLGRFASKAFRRPADAETVERFATLAEGISAQPGQTFEAGIARGLTAILTSPRFLFREEGIEPGSVGRYPLVDEYALASRLSYFLWSSMPDDELFRLAGESKLRERLGDQVKRMLADPRATEFHRNFVGQWLQARDIESVLINAPAVISRDEVPDPEADRRRARFRELNRKGPEKLTDEEKAELKTVREAFFKSFRRFREFELNGELRRAMRRETEMVFEHVVRGDRSFRELLDSDYTFLNERLAKHYGIEGVTGDEMRRVVLPPGSPRGGILTQGTVLVVTSNPDRTSPVKRGLFLLDNILGSPPAPPPPNIPALEEAAKGAKGKSLTLRATLELHRSVASCASCHARMDPLGLALENFNALGRWRVKERVDPIDATGKLITGEPFANVQDLKRILVTNHRRDFYRCLSEKMLTYALGRGLESLDVEAVDALVERLESQDGRASALVLGIIESAPFQRRRRSDAEAPRERAGRDDAPTANGRTN